MTEVKPRKPDLLSAAKCAANVLFLLNDEVNALGCNAKNVRANLLAAIHAVEAASADDISAIRHTLMTGLAHNAAIAALNRLVADVQATDESGVPTSEVPSREIEVVVAGAKVYCCYGMYADVGHDADCANAPKAGVEPSDGGPQHE